MSETALAVGGRVRSRRSRHHTPQGLVARIVCALAALGLGGAGVFWNGVYRGYEAVGAAILLNPLVGNRTAAVGDAFYVFIPGFNKAFAVTAECTAIILVAPILVLTATIILFTRAPLWRVGLGVVAMFVVITVINEIRLAFIAWATMRFGVDAGYPMAHVLVGSIVGILGFAAGLAALLLISLGRRHRRR